MMCKQWNLMLWCGILCLAAVFSKPAYGNAFQQDDRQPYAFIFTGIHSQVQRENIQQMANRFQSWDIPLYLGFDEELQSLMEQEQSLISTDKREYLHWLKTLQEQHVYFLLPETANSREAASYLKRLFQWGITPLGYYYEEKMEPEPESTEEKRMVFSFSIPLTARWDSLSYFPPELVVQRQLEDQEPLFLMMRDVPSGEELKRWFKALEVPEMIPLTPGPSEFIRVDGSLVAIQNGEFRIPENLLAETKALQEEKTWMDSFARIFIMLLTGIIFSLIVIFMRSKKNRDRSLFG
ncbi:hypothetical protein [Tindallia californiensis]|uniref:Uncharacterized protein n=1 Tax=Tindallia californiensis TaxID=159292 RepID=A0A1H3R6X3_9FIRM|nr:hypothetical protein [Tindallia californiensis]SDZ21524.1 hypothetical protein SAMN05192546_11310 [Tindallia californiensis]